jgi:hypothetical protein
LKGNLVSWRNHHFGLERRYELSSFRERDLNLISFDLVYIFYMGMLVDFDQFGE